jgi:hypothetical protein
MPDSSDQRAALAALGIAAPMQPGKTLRVCETCPFMLTNHRQRHDAGWYTVGNLRRLWNGLRTGKAPGMVCHSTDPDSKYYGGKGDIKPGKKAECAGALLLILTNMNAIADDRPQPHTPGLTKAAVANWAWKYLMRAIPAVEDRSADVGLPWMTDIARFRAALAKAKGESDAG